MAIPVSILKKALDNKLGAGSWKDYQVETLILELGLPLTDLLFDQVSSLKVIENAPDIFFEDTMFFIYTTSVLNFEEADFDFLPSITSLEVAFALYEMSAILGCELHQLPIFGQGPSSFIKHVLTNEGYSSVLPPFDVVGIGQLVEGQTEQDTLDKKKAIEEYIHASYNQSTH
jgi:hypothetical protein